MSRIHRCGIAGAAVVAAVAVVLSISACAVHPPRTAAEQAANDQLAATVMSALMNDRSLYARHIDVDADSGLVRLSGYVWSSDELYEAKRAAATVAGVTGVVSQLEIMVGGRAGSR